MSFVGSAKYSPGGGGTGGAFTETLASATTSSIADDGYEELDIGVTDGDCFIDAVYVLATDTGTDVDVEFSIAIHQLDGGNISAADGTHDIQSAYRLIYGEEGITLHNTKINNGSHEAAGQSTLTVDNSTNLRKGDLLYFSDGADTDNWYRVSAVNSSTEIVIYDDLVAQKDDNSDILQVYEKRNLGMFYNKSSANNLYVGILNTSGAARTFTVYVKTTRLA